MTNFPVDEKEEVFDEVEEWSAFMGYRVSPLEIADLKIQLAAKLEMERYRERVSG